MSFSNIMVAGPVYLDTIYAGLPQKPEIGKEIFCPEFKVTIGGMGITAIGLKRLGMEVGFLTAVGDDLAGDLIKDKLKREGVSTEYILTLDGLVTNNSTAMVYRGDRGFVSYKGIDLTIDDMLMRLNGDVFTNLGFFHASILDNSYLAPVLKKARSNSVLTSVVTGWDDARQYSKDQQGFAEILKYTDIFFCNDLEAKTLTGRGSIEAAFTLLAKQTHPVVTLGADGAMTVDQAGKVIKKRALDVNFVDPTGAGDSFIAGYLTAVSKNLSKEKCLALGVICGSLTTRGIGGTTAFPENLAEAEKYLLKEW